MKTVDLGGKKEFVHIVVDGHPEFNSVFTCQEGIKNNLNIPLFGGKIVFIFNKSEKGYHSIIESEGMGKWEMDEEFTAEGVKSIVSKGGNSYIQHWKRKETVDGLYKWKSSKDLTPYLQTLQWPDAMIARQNEYDFFVEAGETSMKVWERIAGIEVTFDGKYNVETGWKLPFPGLPDARLVMKHIGFNKYRWNMTYGPMGEEWTMECTEDGMTLYGKNHLDQISVIEMYKEPLPIMGKWKQISSSGIEEGYKVLGIPSAQAREIAAEIVELDIDEKGPLVHWNWKSKFTPTDITFKWMEELDYYDPMLKETTKNLFTKSGNKMEIVTKSSMGTWITKITAGVTFLTVLSYQEGLETMPVTYTFMRKSYAVHLD